MKSPATPNLTLLTTPPAPRPGWGWWLAFGALVLVVGLVWLPPFVGPGARAFVMQIFHPLCHQLPDRSFHVDGVALAVCHRCLGIYVGLLVGVLLYPGLARWDGWLHHRQRTLLLASLALPGLDWLLGLTGLWANTPLSRTLTGGAFGLVAGYFLARALSEVLAPRPATDPAVSDAVG